MKILLPVDGSPYTSKMLDYVCANRTLFDASHSYIMGSVTTQVLAQCGVPVLLIR